MATVETARTTFFFLSDARRAKTLRGERNGPRPNEHLSETGDHQGRRNCRTRERPRVRRGVTPYSFLSVPNSLPNSRSTAARPDRGASCRGTGQRGRASLAETDDGDDPALARPIQHRGVVATRASRTSRGGTGERRARRGAGRRTATRSGVPSRRAKRAEGRCACRGQGAACSRRSRLPYAC
jgi:hypothetical protein